MGRGVKRERQEPSPASNRASTAEECSNNMAPPSRKQRLEDSGDSRSVAQSFQRSHAPSAETRHRTNDDDQSPMFLERRLVGGELGDSTPLSQAADTSFAHTSFTVSHPTFTNIGVKLREFNNTVGSLQQLGVSHVAELPELVLVGDQSAGKSSLMSGLARVDLPRSAGVGTRCPLHIRLIDSSNGHWSCTVALQIDYDFEPKGRIKRSDVTASNPFPPWVKKSHRDNKIFKTIFDPSEIEEVLRWAQVAILNPGNDHELYIPGDGAVAKTGDLADVSRNSAAQFSPNIISLEIKGPELPGLSFYDLPGVFLSPDQEEDEYIVKVVRNLTTHYIKREGAIIMWALPMNQDPENSISLGIIREAKAAQRTIGIMTKADKLAPENESQWLAMFQGEKQSVGHGFFATSRPPDESLESANAWEQLFFARESATHGHTWPVEFEKFGDRCGVNLLSEYISVQLGNAFAKSLPTIKGKVDTRLREIEHQLDGLPEIPYNVEHAVKSSLHQFLDRMKTAIRDSEFLSEWNTLNTQFRDIIFHIKPTCRVKDPVIQTIDLSDPETEVSAVTPSRRPRPSDSTMRGTPSKRQRLDEMPNTPVKYESFHSGAFASPAISNAPTEMQGPFAGFRNLGRLAMDIKDIQTQIMKKQRPGMPRDLVPDEVRESLCLDAVRKWEGPLEMYIDKTAELLEKVTHEALQESLGVLRRRLIFRECGTHLKNFIDDIVTSQRVRLSEMFDSETYQMYILNEDVFTRYRAQELEQLRRARAIFRLKGAALIEWSYEIRKHEDMTNEEREREVKILNQQLPKLGRDPYETEIEVAAFVRGYYRTAAARFVEGVSMNVNSHLFRRIASRELEVFIDGHFGLYGQAGPGVYTHLMEEDDRTAALRERLKGELEKLSQAMRSIHSLESSPNVSVTLLADSDDNTEDGVL